MAMVHEAVGNRVGQGGVVLFKAKRRGPGRGPRPCSLQAVGPRPGDRERIEAPTRRSSPDARVDLSGHLGRRMVQTRSRLGELVPRRTVITMVVLAALGPGAAFAETGQQSSFADDASSVATIVPGLADQGLLPIAVIDREDIERSGIRNLQELILSRAEFNAFGLHRALFLGRGAVMTMINGQRVSRALGVNGLYVLPVAAIERIEILGAGAGTIRGAHALGGAVNIVTKRDFQGAEAQLFLDRPTAAGGDTEHASGLWGGEVGNGHLTIGADMFRRREIRSSDREFSRTRWQPGGSFADAEGVSVAGNTFFYEVDGKRRGGYLGDCEPDHGYAGPLSEPGGLPGEGCGFAFADFSWLSLREDRHTLFANGDFPIRDDLTLHADARSSREVVEQERAPESHFLEITPTRTLLGRVRTRYPDFPTDFEGALEVLHRFVGHGRYALRGETTEHDFSLSLRGRLRSGPGFEAYARYHDYLYDQRDGARLGDGIIEEIEQGRYRLEDPLSQDPAHVRAIHATSITRNSEWTTTRRTTGFAFHGDLPAGTHERAKWAGGLELDWESWKDVYDYRDADNHPVSHEALLVDGDGSSTGTRQLASFFGEARVPVAETSEVLLQARRDEYDDVGGAFSYQVAGRSRLSESVALRASWGESERPPFIGHLHYTPFVRRERACLSKDDCRYVLRTYAGNRELEPDTTRRLSAGLLAEAGPVSLSFDWFALRASNLTANPTTQRIVDLHLAGDPLPEGVSITEKNGVIESIRGRYTNGGEIEASGIDVRAGMNRETSWGELGLDAFWSHELDYEHEVLGHARPERRPRDRLNIAASVERGDVRVTWNLLARSGLDEDHSRFGGWVGHDLLFQWRAPMGVGGLTLTGGVLNVADRQPAMDSARDDAPITDWEAVRGRTIFVGLRFAPGE